MRLLTGTSGYSYKEWKGPFYPEKAKNDDLLALYAERLPTVEINNTFYRMPKPEVIARWAEAVPAEFVFAIKASQRITHRARLRDAQDSVDYLWNTIGGLGAHLGPVLFQLPPYLRADVPLLRDFLAGLPEGMHSTFEFRHASWSDDAVLTTLEDAGAALCVADSDNAQTPELPTTAPFGYLRLRRAGYDDAELRAWALRITATGWETAYVYFKHEDEGAAPRLAARLAELFAEPTSGD